MSETDIHESFYNGKDVSATLIDPQVEKIY